jgi:hypothetical protein
VTWMHWRSFSRSWETRLRPLPSRDLVLTEGSV